MKTLISLRTLLAAALVCVSLATSLAQGPLNPPGPPMPTMKTLVEMEPRTHITSLPFTITASGSYYLTTNLNGGGAGNGIVIQASGVTIDLRGFSILNCTVGISAAAGVRGVTVHNGMVSGCTGTGIDLSAVNKVRLEDVIVCNNGGDGATVGSASIMTLCTAVANAGRGLALDSGGTVFRCVAQSNSASGITVTSNCQVTDNTCEQNGTGAGQAGVLTTGSGNRVEGNSCNDSAAHGFKINGTGNLVIRNNSCRNAAGDYAVAMGNNYGQVLVAPGAAFVNANPWANFSCGTPPNGPCTTDASCDDNAICTTDVCDRATGQCSHTPIPNCNEPVCGNGTVDPGETCDDGNMVNGDGCDNNCTLTGCGNGVVTAGEQCDDGNLINGDGCSATCQIQCVTASQCDDGNPCTTDYCMGGVCGHSPVPNCGGICGNGMVEMGEQCDDGNTMNGDGCDNNCRVTACGNGIVTGMEQCDDGNAVNGDGCDNNCLVTACGNGIVTGMEQCDDGNIMNGDGCSATCQIENNPCMDGQTRACYTGPAGTAGVGICRAGTQTCSMSTWGPCVGQVTPAPEICDALDNDCDGQIDEACGPALCGNNIVEPGEQCDDGNFVNGDGCNAVCQIECASAMQCNDGNPCTTDYCMGGVCGHAPVPNCVGVCGNNVVEMGEQCDDGNLVNGDGCDSNCRPTACGNGIVTAGEQCDDGNTMNGDGCSATCQIENTPCMNGQTRACYSGPPATASVGICQYGTQTCSMNTWGPCIGEVIPQPEICDGLDNDCDGQTDNGLGTITCGVGACQRTVDSCVGGQTQSCTPGTPVAEICGNGIDDNCNGSVDEGCGGAVCGNGIVEPGETCDDANFVNGDGCSATCQIENNPCMDGQTRACYTGPAGTAGVGICQGGTQTCSMNTWGPCIGEVTPQPEICDALDNDCDGQVDEGNPSGGLACNTGQVGVCAGGTTVCSGGAIVCNRNVNPSAENCDGLDNDCDGQVDEGNPGGGQACNTGQLGVCAIGTAVCSGGAVVCNRNVNPSAEICDGQDNDCDGQVDEGNPNGGQACNTGQLGVCAGGTTACSGGAVVCNRNVNPSAEICDGQDNDCDGTVDEGCGGAVCGNGIVEPGETCDDANFVNGDGCSAVCTVQPGFTCVGTPSVCTVICGDGIVAGGESCDDANQTSGDGCSATCQVEPGFTCSGSPSACTPVNHQLTTARAGTGTGTITSVPTGINCGADCTEAYSAGTVVTLTASPNANSTFAGWSGGCVGTGTCVVTMNNATSVTATFLLNTFQLTVTRAGNGAGTVTSAPTGINCGADCTEAYNAGTVVTLTASPNANSTFAGWSGGGCAGTGACVVTMSSARSVTATFTSQ